MASLNLLDPRLRSPKPTASVPSQAIGRVEEEENESEWEYEYSTTETETFYVTLDLSTADFKAQDQVKSNDFPSRGRWQLQRATQFRANRASHNSGASSAGSSDAERDDEDRPDISRKDRDKQIPSLQDDDSANPEKVQILELHSENPIISYKGRVFSGRWCENTTTELLMTRSDEGNPLPVLRHLENGVDLLAASSARINVTEQKFKPKVSNRERQRASAHLPQTIIPPVDLKASQERIDQRNFLADLIALKRRKGETDDVTVIARSMQGKRAQTKVKGVRTHRRGRWAHPNKLHAVRGLEERPRRGGRRRGSGRARGKWALFPLEEPAQDPASAASSRVASPAEGETSISTPTPFRWDDLEEGQDDSLALMEGIVEADEADEDDEQDEQEEDDGEDDDNNDYDEDEEDDQGEMDEDED
ncbi:hypothetical protein F4680DRAFT_404084 [Xylaria scruposa]|nr:hypothetical protein F4680DRAFT_404084 [Xylaria scruposa]